MKNHMINSGNTEKKYLQNSVQLKKQQQPFLINFLANHKYRNFLNLIMSIHKTILNGNIFRVFHFISRTTKGCLLTPFLFKLLISAWKRNKKNKHWKIRTKNLYKKNTKESADKFTELINQCGKIVGYKVNIQNKLHFYVIAIDNLKTKNFKDKISKSVKILNT